MIRAILTIFLICFSTLMWSQSEQQKKLEQQKIQIQKQIREFQNLLKDENKKEKSVLGQITEKNAKIRLSENLINTTQKQTKLLNDDIYLNQLQINKLNRELESLKQDYANMIVKSYKSRSEQSRIMFILSSDSFLQAYKRMQYMKQYANFRKMQGDEIREKTEKLEVFNQKLAAQKAEKQRLLEESEKERLALQKEKQEQEKLVKIIQKDKRKYTADIKKKQQQAKDIDRQIAKIIREAIAAANKKTAAAAGTKKETAAAANASPNKIVLTPEGKIIADNFKANRGKLPWPVEKGYISLPYGNQPHPLERGIIQHNSGVEITTEAGANARAVFGGEVMSVQVIGANKSVYVQHGDYITVYFNLSTVNVTKGDKVSIRQNIGRVATNNDGNTVIKFLILQNTTTLNPQSWLNK